MSKKELNRKAHFLYNHILKEVVEPLTGDKTTYLNELNGSGKKLLGVKFKGVFPSDKIPKLNDLAPYCILNLDKSGEPGSHWIALAKLENGNSLVYDSFARDHKQIIPNLQFSGNGRILEADRSDKEQLVKETNCGARALSWLILLDTWGWKYAKMV